MQRRTAAQTPARPPVLADVASFVPNGVKHLQRSGADPDVSRGAEGKLQCDLPGEAKVRSFVSVGIRGRGCLTPSRLPKCLGAQNVSEVERTLSFNRDFLVWTCQTYTLKRPANFPPSIKIFHCPSTSKQSEGTAPTPKGEATNTEKRSFKSSTKGTNYRIP